jgi:hypothetical protein
MQEACHRGRNRSEKQVIVRPMTTAVRKGVSSATPNATDAFTARNQTGSNRELTCVLRSRSLEYLRLGIVKLARYRRSNDGIDHSAAQLTVDPCAKEFNKYSIYPSRK